MLVVDFRESVWLGYYSLSIMIWTLWAFYFFIPYCFSLLLCLELLFTGHFLMHCDAFHQQNSDPPPALPVRSLRKVQA